MRLWLKFYQKEDGIAAIEGALLFPMLTVIGFGVVDTSILMMQTHQLRTGLGTAGNYLSRTVNPEVLENRAKQIAISGKFDPNASPYIKDMTPADILITYRDVPNPETDGLRHYRGGDTVRIVNLSGTTEYKGIGILKIITGGNLSVAGQYETRLIGAAL
jgi:hypothetical protein